MFGQLMQIFVYTNIEYAGTSVTEGIRLLYLKKEKNQQIVLLDVRQLSTNHPSSTSHI